MIRFPVGRLRTWVRPSWFLLMMLASYLMFEALYARFVWRHPLANRFDVEFIISMRDFLMLLFVTVAGGLRAGSHHPLFWIDYGRWLVRTPWRVSKPLPLGPLHLVPADVVFLIVVVLLLHNPVFNMLLVPLLFLCGYLALVCLSMWQTETKGYAYALSFGLGLVARFWLVPWGALFAAAALYLVAYFGTRRSLAGFPWSKAELLSNREPPQKSALAADIFKLAMSSDLGLRDAMGANQTTKPLGWPFDLLQPNQPRMAINWIEGIGVSLLLGWWVYSIAANPIASDAREFLLKICLLGIPTAMSIIRLGRYGVNYSSPINGWGRLFTLRWIIPGYDKIFVAPLLAVLITFVGGWLMTTGLKDPLIVAPATIICASMVVLNFGPTLQDWRHTGNHRIAPRFNPKAHLKL